MALKVGGTTVVNDSRAQDIAAIESEGVVIDITNPEKLYYNESNLIPILVKAIQELKMELDNLKRLSNK